MKGFFGLKELLSTLNRGHVYGVLDFGLAVLDSAYMAPEASNRTLREANNPLYWNTEAKTKPLKIGPSVWPTSIIVLRNPIDEPTKPSGASSLMRGEVEEMTMAKPNP